MTEPADSTKATPPDESASKSAAGDGVQRSGRWVVIGVVGFAVWMWLTLEAVTYFNYHLFPLLFPPGLLRPQAHPFALLVEAILMLLIGLGIGALFSPSRRSYALRTLPTLFSTLCLTFWLGGGEVAQIDERGFWRTQAVAVADQFYPWQDVRSIKILPYVWHRQDLQGMHAELRLRLLITPKTGPASLVDVGQRPDWRRLESLLLSLKPIVSADEPDGLVASVYRFQPDAPQADLLRRFVKPPPPPQPKLAVKPNDPMQYWWLKKRKQRHRSH